MFKFEIDCENDVFECKEVEKSDVDEELKMIDEVNMKNDCGFVRYECMSGIVVVWIVGDVKKILECFN